MKTLITVCTLAILCGCIGDLNPPLTWKAAQEANTLCEAHNGAKFIYPVYTDPHKGEYYRVECNDNIWINNLYVNKK